MRQHQCRSSLAQTAVTGRDDYDIYAASEVGTFQQFGDSIRKTLREKLRLTGEDSGIRYDETFALIGQIGGDGPPVIDRSGKGCPKFMCHDDFDELLRQFPPTQEAAMNSKKWMEMSEVMKIVPPKGVA